MEIKRKLVGTQAEMIDFLTEARDAVVAIDAAMEGQRDDTRIRRAERRGYHDGLDFAVKALTDWEPTQENESNGTGVEQVQGVPGSPARRPSTAPATMRDTSGSGEAPTSR
jgi:hypothetical protein